MDGWVSGWVGEILGGLYECKNVCVIDRLTNRLIGQKKQNRELFFFQSL